MNIKNVQNKAITRAIYIGQKVTLLKINGLRSENQKTKKINDGGNHAPLS